MKSMLMIAALLMISFGCVFMGAGGIALFIRMLCLLGPDGMAAGTLKAETRGAAAAAALFLFGIALMWFALEFVYPLAR